MKNTKEITNELLSACDNVNYDLVKNMFKRLTKDQQASVNEYLTNNVTQRRVFKLASVLHGTNCPVFYEE